MLQERRVFTNDIMALPSWMTCSPLRNISHYLKLPPAPFPSHNEYDCLLLCHWSINTKGHYVTDTGAFCIVSITAIQVSEEDTAKGRQPCYQAGPMHCTSAWASQVSSSTKREKAQSVKTPHLLLFTEDNEELNHKFPQQSLKS